MGDVDFILDMLASPDSLGVVIDENGMAVARKPKGDFVFAYRNISPGILPRFERELRQAGYYQIGIATDGSMQIWFREADNGT